MPSLRERKEDIPLLCKHFIKQFNREQNKTVKKISTEAEKLLLEYDYPGNVRQLANILEHAMILTNTDEIDVDNLPMEIRNKIESKGKMHDESFIYDFLIGKTIKEIELLAIKAVLKKNDGRRDFSAEELGISIRSLHNKIKEYEL